MAKSRGFRPLRTQNKNAVADTPITTVIGLICVWVADARGAGVAVAVELGRERLGRVWVVVARDGFRRGVGCD